MGTQRRKGEQCVITSYAWDMGQGGGGRRVDGTFIGFGVGGKEEKKTEGSGREREGRG